MQIGTWTLCLKVGLSHWCIFWYCNKSSLATSQGKFVYQICVSTGCYCYHTWSLNVLINYLSVTLTHHCHLDVYNLRLIFVDVIWFTNIGCNYKPFVASFLTFWVLWNFFKFMWVLLTKPSLSWENLNIKHKYYTSGFIFLVSLLFWDQTQV